MSVGAKTDIKFTRFLRRLVHFFKPSSNKFSHQDIGMGKTMPAYVSAGIKLIDWLLGKNEVKLNLDCIYLILIHILTFSTQISLESSDIIEIEFFFCRWNQFPCSPIISRILIHSYLLFVARKVHTIVCLVPNIWLAPCVNSTFCT